MSFSPEVKGSKKGVIFKTWERCKSFSGLLNKRKGSLNLVKSKSCPHDLHHHSRHDQENGSRTRSNRVAPEGCLSIYVGPERRRFVIKTEYVNHPLLKILLEEAESEYGYRSEGPLVLPCQVSQFMKVLMEMDSDKENRAQKVYCSFGSRNHSASYQLLAPVISPRSVANLP